MRAALAVLLAAGAVVGCAGGTAGSSAGPASTSSTLVAAPGAGDGAVVTPSSAAVGAPPAGTSDGGTPSTRAAGATATTAGTAVIAVGSTGVGGVAPALLRPGRGDRVVLEVRSQAGAAPVSGTLDHLVRTLRDASGKQVAVDGPDGIDGGAREWTPAEIVQAATSAARTESGRSQVVLRLLYLRGSFEGDTGVLGVAVAGDVAAVFSDQVDASAGVLVPPAVVEDAVSMHEVGHLLGLVDLVLHTGRGDPGHPGHSRNRHSVMYWQVESGLVTQLLDGGIPTELDGDDRAELAQIRAG